MRKYFKLLFILSFIGIASCQKDKSTKEIEYTPEALEQGMFQELKLTNIPTDFLFANPKQIDRITDSLLVVFDKAGNQRIAHLFNDAGNHVKSFGMIGKGHGEMIYPEGFNIGQDGKTIYFFDWRTAFSVKFPLENILSQENTPTIINNLDSTNHAIPHFDYIIRFTDTEYIGFAHTEETRIMCVDHNKPTEVYKDYPQVDENAEITRSIWYNMACQGISPDRKHIVITTRIGALLEVFELQNGKITSKTIQAFHKPEFGLAEGVKPACATFNEKTFGGFSTLYCTNKSFFGVIDGPAPDYSHHNEIYEFDYSGELINKYKIDGEVACLTVSPEDEMYLIVTDKDGEQHLMKADLKAVKE